MLTPQSPSAPHKYVGIGYKSKYLDQVLAAEGEIGWLEIHAENYMMDGGPRKALMQRLAEQYPISCHGVGLSIGSENGLDLAHLGRLRKLIDWLQPASFSEHLAWSSHNAGYFNDLLPLPYTEVTLARIARHIDQVQETLGRQMLLENPSTYITFATTEMSETDFIAELARRTGCGLLLDVNNVFISATNQGYDPIAYIDAFPLAQVAEIHLGGHEPDFDASGRPLLIDAHNNPVVDAVWTLYDYVIGKTGPMATLIEWDNDLPEWPILRDEARRAKRHLATLLLAENVI